MVIANAISRILGSRLTLFLLLLLFWSTGLCAQEKSAPVPPPPDEQSQSGSRTVARHPLHARRLTAEEIFREYAPSVVLIRTANRTGTPLAQASGIVISEGGLILTNYQVLEGACDVSIEMETSEDPVPVRWLIASDKRRDLVAISTESRAPAAPPVGSSRKLQPGAKVVVIGNPEGLARSISEGMIAGRRNIHGEDWLQITAPISHGSSGGGVFDAFGNLIGITTASLEGGQNINFAIPIEAVDSLFQLQKGSTAHTLAECSS